MAAPSSRDARIRIACRTLAIVIAVAAVIDPAITTTRAVKPVVAVVPVNTAHPDSALVTRVARALADDFRVITARFGAADATVLVGDELPASTAGLVSPAFAVRPDHRTPRLDVRHVHTQDAASLHAPAHVSATLHARGADGRTIALALEANGIIVDRAEHAVSSADTLVHAALAFVPADTGAARLRVVATVNGSPDSSAADLIVRVHDRPLEILVYDPRPSWMSTFVRRALERDARLAVTSRIVTSRGISTAAGAPPARLDDPAGLARFDAIVAGAPEALSARDVAGLDTFLRRRGGSVVLLLDARPSGPVDRLLGVRDWRQRRTDLGAVVTPLLADTGTLRTAEQLWPAVLPAGAEPLVHADTGSEGTSAAAPPAGDPVLWHTAVGAGRLVVSGALDAWRFRDPEVSSFDRVWPAIVAGVAGAAPPPVRVTVTPAVLAPNDDAVVTVTLRDLALAGAAGSITLAGPERPVSVSAILEHGSGPAITRLGVRLWPGGPAGSLRGTFRAPATPGPAHLLITAGDHHTAVPLAVDSAPRRPTGDPGLLDAWTSARGGRVVAASDLSALPAALTEALQPARHPERWRPMRSPWWLAPFALALAADWWLRRRRGLA